MLCYNPTVLQFPDAINIFHSTNHSKGVSVGAKPLETHIYTLRTDLNVQTNIHKVQESASRTAVGAVLPIGFILVSVLHHVHVSHLHSKVQSSPVHPKSSRSCRVLSYQLPPRMWGWLCLSFLSTPLPAANVQVSSVKSLLVPSETQISFAWSREISWSADVLLTSLRIQKKEAHFASQEVDMDLKQFCCGGRRPCSLKPCSTCWWGIFLIENTKQLLSSFGKCVFF